MAKKKNKVHNKVEHSMTNTENSTRKVISLDKDVSKVSNHTTKSVYENGQRVLYPESTATEEIYPKTAEPRVAFPVGGNNSEEILPRQNKKEMNPESQRVCYPKGSDSEEKMLVKEEEVKEENKDSKLSDLSEYYDYETDDSKQETQEQNDGEQETQEQNDDDCERTNCPDYKEISRSINLYIIREGIVTTFALAVFGCISHITGFIDTTLLKDLSTEVLEAVNCILTLIFFTVTSATVVRLSLDIMYLYIPVARYYLKDSKYVASKTKQLAEYLEL